MQRPIFRFAVFMFLTVSVVVPVVGQEASSSPWTDLFNGKDLQGWKHDPIGKAEYKVVDGAIHGVTVEGSSNSFLYTQKEYGNFGKPMANCEQFKDV